jgi:hypothetical protein
MAHHPHILIVLMSAAVWRGLLERLQPFGSDRELKAGEAREIAARMRQV